jgi:folate-binding protein YgfZ
MPERSVEGAFSSVAGGALIVRHPDPGLVVARGKDRLDLLHRMSTNDVAGMPVGTTRRTVLTNPIGRIVDAIRILSLEEEALLVTSPDRAEAVRKWLQGYIFFQDDVQLSLRSAVWSAWGVYGRTSDEDVQSAFPDMALPEGESFNRSEGGFIWHVDKPAPGGYRLLLGPDQTGRARELWRGRGGEGVDAAAYQILRIEAGLPEPPREIREDSIPLEVGLREAISFTKGCYIGQEIIARMDSRGRQARALVGLQLSHEANAGDVVYQLGRDVGAITSVARSPSLGWIALASLRPKVLDVEGGRVQVGAARSPACAVSLPMGERAAEATRAASS